jgi:hypothetical protein
MNAAIAAAAHKTSCRRPASLARSPACPPFPASRPSPGRSATHSRAGKVLPALQCSRALDPSDCARAQKSRAGDRQGCGLTIPLTLNQGRAPLSPNQCAKASRHYRGIRSGEH